MPAPEAPRLGGPLLEGRSAIVIVTGSEIDSNGGSHIH
jgi:hypothetical protein